MDHAAFIAGLSAADRAELLARLARDDGKARAGGKGYPADQLELWDMLNEVCGKLPMPMGVFIKQYGVAKFAAAAAMLDAFVMEATPDLTRRPVTRAVKAVCLECIGDYLRGRRIVAGPSVILGMMSIVRQCVDQAFPGYADAKLLHHVARASGKLAA